MWALTDARPFARARRLPARAAARWAGRRYLDAGRYLLWNAQRDEDRRLTADRRSASFDWFEYEAMTADRLRNACYERDIRELVPGKRVLEIGTGPVGFLTKLCIDSGASHVVTVEGNPHAARSARAALRREIMSGRCTLVTKMSDSLNLTDCGGDLRFDLLVMELYDSIACRENVCETVAGLQRLGVTFDAAISHGYTTFAAPARQPPLTVPPIERAIGGWRRTDLDAGRLTLRSVVLGDQTIARAMALAERQPWQQADFVRSVSNTVEADLCFAWREREQIDGVLFSNTFHFYKGDLDTLEDRTHWGTYFLPLRVEGPTTGATLRFRPGRSPAEFTVELETEHGHASYCFDQ